MSDSFDVAFQILICRREKMVLQNAMNVLDRKDPKYFPWQFEKLAAEFGQLLLEYPAD